MLGFNTNMPFFVLNSQPTLFSVTHTVQCSYTTPHIIHNAHRHACLKRLLYPDISYSTYIQSQHSVRTLLLAKLPLHKVSIHQPDTDRATAGLGTGIYDILQHLGCSCRESCTQHITLMRRKRCKCFQKYVRFHVHKLLKAHSPLVLCTLLVATHEKSLNKEFQGGACSATLAGFDFTWTRDIGVEHSCSPSTPYFSGLFHGNHTVAAAQNTPQNRGSHFSLPVSHFGSISS